MSGPRDLDESIWIDYIEDELDPSLRDDLTTLIPHSGENKEILKDYQSIRGNLEKVGKAIEVPTDENYFNDFHDRIMARVKNTKMQSPVVVRLFQKRVYRAVAGVALFLIIGSAIWNTANLTGGKPGDIEVAKSSNWLLESSVKNPEMVPNTVLTPGETDMVMDAAAEKLDKMSEKEREQVFRRLAD